MRTTLSTLLAALALAGPAGADEGMWTFNAFPRAAVEKKHGFRATDAWLDHVRLASARLARGCSASFVSEDGLVMTNHHCARSCLAQLSTAERNLERDGFLARSNVEELRCPTAEVNQLLDVADVTAEVHRATAGLEGRRYAEAERTATARIEKACQTSEALRCEVVSLYSGGVYELYRYRRFQDARLVFAPEQAAAHFGGDLDNFNFPRWCLDVAFLRVYQGGKPARMDQWFRWSAAGAREGDLVFVSGNPGATERLRTVAELEYERDVALPEGLLRLAELRGVLEEHARRGPEQQRVVQAELLAVENGYKVLLGRLEALRDPSFLDKIAGAEKAFQAELQRDASLRAALPAFDAIAASVGEYRKIHVPLTYLEAPRDFRRAPWGFSGSLFRHARDLVRGTEEREKPDEERLREYRTPALPAVVQALLAPTPIYPEKETLELAFSLDQLRRALGPEDPLVKKVFGPQSPDELAARLVQGTRLADPAVRRALWEGGRKAVEGSKDPMIELARRIDPEARALRRDYEERIDPARKRSAQILTRARFALRGTETYPDATFSPRISYGLVKGWREDGQVVAPITTLAGAFGRATGRSPFALPERWLRAARRLDLATPYDFSSDNDVVGGNSGSPVVDRRGEIVGLVFDGNIHSLAGDYAFDETSNRTVSVHGAAILEALSRIYGADRLVEELRRR